MAEILYTSNDARSVLHLRHTSRHLFSTAPALKHCSSLFPPPRHFLPYVLRRKMRYMAAVLPLLLLPLSAAVNWPQCADALLTHVAIDKWMTNCTCLKVCGPEILPPPEEDTANPPVKLNPNPNPNGGFRGAPSILPPAGGLPMPTGHQFFPDDPDDFRNGTPPVQTPPWDQVPPFTPPPGSQVSTDNPFRFRCYCDNACDKYGDCCSSVPNVCPKKGLSSSQPVKSARTRDDLRRKCINPVANAANMSGKGYYMISDCLPNFNEPSTKSACEQVDSPINLDNLVSIMPVTVNGVTYRNAFCAACNNVSDLSLYEYWKPEFSCQLTEHTATSFLSYVNTLPSEDGVSFLNSHCGVKTFSAPLNYSEERIRPCFIVNDTCLPFNELKEKISGLSLDQYNCLEEACHQLTEVVISDNILFKNRYCAVCNGYLSQSCVFGSLVDDSRPTFGFSFVMLMDFTASGNILLSTSKSTVEVTLSRSCPTGQVYDFHVKKCRPLFCLTSGNYSQSVCENPEVMDSVSLTITEFNITLVANVTSPRFKEIYKQMQEKILDDFVSATNRLISTSAVEDVQFYLLPNSNTLVVTFITPGRKLPSPFLNGSVLFTTESVQFHIASVTHKVVIINYDQPELSDCPAIILNATEFTRYRNGAVLEHATGLIWQPNQYNLLEDGRLARCNLNYSRNYTETRNETVIVWDTNSPIVILSLAGSILNIVSCFIVFITYATIKSLRTLPGLSLMNLVAAIFFSHLFLVAGAGQVQDAALCTAMAFLLHYFFLSTFTWSTAMAYDLLRTFVMDKGTGMKQPTKKRFCISFLASWGLPLLVCIICLALDETDVVSIQYGTESVCWIGNRTALLVVFVVPVAALVFFNAIAFIAMFWSVHKTVEQSYSLRSIDGQGGEHSSKVESRKRKKKAVILGSVFSLLGLTWLFALLAAANETRIFWYPFVICTAFQGVFILLCFVLKPKVRTALRRNICKLLGLWTENDSETPRRSTGDNNQTRKTDGCSSASITHL